MLSISPNTFSCSNIVIEAAKLFEYSSSESNAVMKRTAENDEATIAIAISSSEMLIMIINGTLLPTQVVNIK